MSDRLTLLELYIDALDRVTGVDHRGLPFISLLRVEDAKTNERHRTAPRDQTFVAALQPLLVGAIELTEYELVTSSDLAPRHRRPR